MYRVIIQDLNNPNQNELYQAITDMSYNAIMETKVRDVLAKNKTLCEDFPEWEEELYKEASKSTPMVMFSEEKIHVKIVEVEKIDGRSRKAKNSGNAFSWNMLFWIRYTNDRRFSKD